MIDKDNRCVYNGLEYIVTGRVAKNKQTSKCVFEIRPKKTFGFEDQLNIWVPIEELYFITTIEEE